MNEQISLLNLNLRELMGLHKQLLDAVRSERGALEKADLKLIHESTCAKEAILSQIRNCEIQRRRIIAELAATWVEPADELTLTRVIERVQGTDLKAADQLRSVMNALVVLVKHIRDQNKENEGLVNESLKHIVNMKKNVLGEAAPAAGAYNRQGQRQGPQTVEPRMLAQEA